MGPDGSMLINTLSPDSYPLGRDGRKITNSELLPAAFSGTREDFIAYHNAVMSFCDGVHESFNDTYDASYLTILHVKNSGDYSAARAALARIDAYDFTDYMNSQNGIIRKIAVNNEIFRIEQVYYLSEIIAACERQDWDRYSAICDNMSDSVSNYADNFIAIIELLTQWDVY